MLRRLARPLLGLAFVSSGLEILRDPHRRAERARAMGLTDAPSATRAMAGVQLAAGGLLLIGRLPRVASLALAATVAPDAMTGHAFWAEDDKQRRQAQRSLFVRDLGLLGGLLTAVADTGGRESLPHRARRTAKRARRTAKAAAHVAG